MPRLVATSLLVLTTLLWGMAFVAQKSAMEALGPLTFTAVRYALGALAILPLVIWELRRSREAVTRATGGSSPSWRSPSFSAHGCSSSA
jgi:drug/metabolite transporter (DMT)-like permease